MTLGASAIIARFREALDNSADWTERGYANIVVDAEAVRDAVVLLGEMSATADDPEVSA